MHQPLRVALAYERSKPISWLQHFYISNQTDRGELLPFEPYPVIPRVSDRFPSLRTTTRVTEHSQIRGNSTYTAALVQNGGAILIPSPPYPKNTWINTQDISLSVKESLPRSVKVVRKP